MHRKGLVIGILILMLGVNIGSTFAGDVDVKTMSSVGFDGNTLYVGGSGPNNYTSIQDAIDNASDGDTVFVYNGTYHENVVVNKTINLFGEDRNSTVIDAQSSGNNIVVENAYHVVISGFTMQNATFSLLLWNTCKYSSIHDNVIKNNMYDGITLYCSYCIIRSNIIKNNGQSGISCSNPTFGYSNNICNNIIHNNNDDGIRLCSDGNNIVGNTISENNLYGIRLTNKSCNNSLYHNNIINNTQNAYDECNNTWDNGYPSCGNYWSDYSGVDNYSGPNQNILGPDGVGDIPYDLPCEYATDRYPLMEPYGMTKLTMSIGAGLLKSSASIKNIGNKTAFNVQWKITFEGGFILIGRNSSGTIQRPLLPGEETSISSRFVLGFGRITITVAVWADNAPKLSGTIEGILLLFFLMIIVGG